VKPLRSYEELKAPKPVKDVKPLARRTRVRKVNRKRQGQRFPGRQDEAQREFVRGQPCAIAVCPGTLCEGFVEAAHVIGRGTGAFDAGDLVPLCRHHHSLHHTLGTDGMYQHTGINLAEDAIRLYHRWLEAQQPNDVEL
jgi:hypothetical protein